MCGFLREKLEIYLKRWSYNYEKHGEFSKGGKVDHCLFTLQYIANKTFDSTRKKHKKLFFVMEDFKKAYVSVDRKSLIEILIKYKINPRIIK